MHSNFKNHLTFKLDDDDQKIVGENTGFYLGFVADFQLAENFSIQPNLLFAMKGGGLEGYKISTMHVDLPVNFLYTTNGFFVGAGPYTLKKFEIGANVLLGYTFPSGLTLSVNFTPGLNNIYEGEEGNDEVIVTHFKTFSFSIGYMFGKKK